MMSDPKVKIVLTINGKQYLAGLDRAKKETEQLGKTTGRTAADVNHLGKTTSRTTKDVNRLSSANKKGVGALSSMKQATTGASVKTKKLGKDSKRTAANLNHLKGVVRLLGGAFAVWQIARVVNDLKATALQAEAINNKMRFAAGGSNEAAEAMAFVRRESNRLGLDLLNQADAYASIAAASKGSQLEGAATREIYLGVAEASAALSLSTDQSRGAMRALEQIMSKGTVQAEELRGQLGERIPGAFQIAARAMNVTTVELNKMLELGQVLAVDFLPKFSAELRRTFGEDAVKNAESARASFNKLDTAFFELKSTLGDDLNSALSDTADWLTILINKTTEWTTGVNKSLEGLNFWEREIIKISESLKEAELDLISEKISFATFNPFDGTYAERVQDARDKIQTLKLQMVDINEEYNKFGTFSTENKPTEQTQETVDTNALKTGTDLQQKLERQIALYGQVGEAAKLRYETERGALSGLDIAQKEKLIGLAEELEFIKANDEAIRDAIQTQNDSIAIEKQLAADKQEIINTNLQSIGLNSATEAEAESQRYQLALEQLQTAENAKIDTLIGYDELRTRLKIEHEGRLTSITQQGLSDRERFEQLSAVNKSKTVFGFMAGILGSAARHNKKLFKVNQVVGVANATISMYEGVMKAWAMGPILGPLLAPIVAAAGLVNIRAIKNASFGGGGAVGTYSASPSTGLPSADPFARSVSAGRQDTQGSSGNGITEINVIGRPNDNVSVEQMETIFENIEEATERGDRILFTRNSRQGLELTEGLENVA